MCLQFVSVISALRDFGLFFDVFGGDFCVCFLFFFENVVVENLTRIILPSFFVENFIMCVPKIRFFFLGTKILKKQL